jgi:uncharacterized protein (DUF934 family)
MMKFIDSHRDPWRTLGGDDGPPVSITPAPHLLLDLAQWHAVRAAWPAALPVGVKLANDQDVELLEADLPRLALVVLQFPKWVAPTARRACCARATASPARCAPPATCSST